MEIYGVAAAATDIPVIWNGHAVVGADPFEPGGGAMTVVSDNVGDTGSVTVRGVNTDLAGFVEEVTLNGTTPVAIPGNVLRVNELVHDGTVPGAVNQGTITVQLAAAVIAQIDVGEESSQSAIWAAPSDARLAIHSFTCALLGTSARATVAWFFRPIEAVSWRPFSQPVALHSDGTSTFQLRAESDTILFGGFEMRAEASGVVGAPTIYAGFTGYGG